MVTSMPFAAYMAGSGKSLRSSTSISRDHAFPPGVVETIHLLYKVQSCHKRYNERLVHLQAEAHLVSKVRTRPLHEELQEVEEVIAMFEQYGRLLVQVILRGRFSDQSMVEMIKTALVLHEINGLEQCDVQLPAMIGTCRF